MSEMTTGVVMPVGAGRGENVVASLKSLAAATKRPGVIVLVLDGHDEIPALGDWPSDLPVHLVHMRKHQPGAEQPRNAGVRVMREHYPAMTHAWFVDSDLLVDERALGWYATAHNVWQDRNPVLIGPYEWLPPGTREALPGLFNDPRWEMFRERGRDVHSADLGVALGNFSGNLVWPVDRFIEIGGFHPMLHHGRCEDGELGLRAAAHRVPMVLVPEARAWHLHHEVNHDLAVERNARDVPLLNSWHPAVQERGIITTAEDGARFDFVCSCGTQMNTLLMWEHFRDHPGGAEKLILPEGL